MWQYGQKGIFILLMEISNAYIFYLKTSVATPIKIKEISVIGHINLILRETILQEVSII
jgi:hypothetical protein